MKLLQYSKMLFLHSNLALFWLLNAYKKNAVSVSSHNYMYYKRIIKTKSFND